MEKIKSKLKLLLLAEIVILISLITLLVIRSENAQPINATITDWQSDYVEYNSAKGWYISSSPSGKTEGETTVFLSGPYSNLPKGTYSATIKYHCDEDQSWLANPQDSRILSAGSAFLSRKQNHAIYRFELQTYVEDFELQILYSGKGDFQVTDISITPTYTGFLRIIILLAVLFLCLDLFILYYDRIIENKNLLLTLSGILLLSSLPLLTNGIAWGHDMPFHLMRIEAIANELRMLNIPVRMSSIYMDGAGYPVSIYYGDLLLYIPALLRLSGFSVTTAYKFYIFIINVGTVIITYFCMDKIFKNKSIACLTSLAYCTSSYRLVNIYVRTAVGEYSAMMFLPLIALAIYRIYTDNVDDYKTYRKNALFLALGMTGVIGCHILSTEMVVFVLAVISVGLLKLTLRKNTIRVYIRAVLYTCAFSAYFVIPFLDYFKNVSVLVTSTAQNIPTYIQHKGSSLSEYFSFFRDIYGGGSSSYTNDRMLLTPGLILMLTLVVAIVLWINRKCSKEMKALTLCALFTLYLASNLFPWNFLAQHSRIGIMLSQIQYPWRYIGLSAIVLSLLLGTLLQKAKAYQSTREIQSGMFILLACFLTTCLFNGYYNASENTHLCAYYDSSELSTYYIGNGEYLRQMEGWDTQPVNVIYRNMEQVSVESRQGCYMKLYCKGTDTDGEIYLPVWNYKGYHVIDDAGNEYAISDSDNKQIQFTLPAGFDGYITLDFIEPWYWRLAEFISLASVIFLWFRRKQLFSENSGQSEDFKL